MIKLVNKKREQSKANMNSSVQSMAIEEEEQMEDSGIESEIRNDLCEYIEQKNPSDSRYSNNLEQNRSISYGRQSNSNQDKLKSFYHIRFSKDYQELLRQNLSDETCSVLVAEPQQFTSHIKLNVELLPHQGQFAERRIPIFFILTKDYPFKPVLAFAEEYVYHPNVNNNSKQIYWKILDEREWKPTLTLYFIILQLKFAFIEPDLSFVPNTPECIECAELFQCNKIEFKRRFEMFYQSNDTSALEDQINKKMKIKVMQPREQQEQEQMHWQNMNEQQIRQCNYLHNFSSEIENHQSSLDAMNFHQNMFIGQNNKNNNGRNLNEYQNNNIPFIAETHTNMDLNNPFFNQSLSQLQQQQYQQLKFSNNQSIFPGHLKSHLQQLDINQSTTFEDHVNFVFQNNFQLSHQQEENQNYQQQRQQLNLSLSSQSSSSSLDNHKMNGEDKVASNDGQLTPTLKKERQQLGEIPASLDFNSCFENIEEEGGEDSQSQNQPSSQKYFFNSMLDTTSCQINPKRRRLMNDISSNDQPLSIQGIFPSSNLM